MTPRYVLVRPASPVVKVRTIPCTLLTLHAMPFLHVLLMTRVTKLMSGPAQGSTLPVSVPPTRICRRCLLRTRPALITPLFPNGKLSSTPVTGTLPYPDSPSWSEDPFANIPILTPLLQIWSSPVVLLAQTQRRRTFVFDPSSLVQASGYPDVVLRPCLKSPPLLGFGTLKLTITRPLGIPIQRSSDALSMFSSASIPLYPRRGALPLPVHRVR